MLKGLSDFEYRRSMAEHMGYTGDMPITETDACLSNLTEEGVEKLKEFHRLYLYRAGKACIGENNDAAEKELIEERHKIIEDNTKPSCKISVGDSVTYCQPFNFPYIFTVKKIKDYKVFPRKNGKEGFEIEQCIKNNNQELLVAEDGSMVISNDGKPAIGMKIEDRD